MKKLIWIGAGASKAVLNNSKSLKVSECLQEMPLSSEFFKCEGVKVTIRKYLFLKHIYKKFKEILEEDQLDNLEMFWSKIDELYNELMSNDKKKRNQAFTLLAISGKELLELLEESINTHEAPLSNYYLFYKNEFVRHQNIPPESILVTVAGWELKNLVVEVYNKELPLEGRDMFKEKLFDPLGIKYSPKDFVVISFNYDTFIEQALRQDRIKFHYVGNKKNGETGGVKVIKPHGSINLKTRVRCDGLDIGWSRSEFEFTDCLSMFIPKLNFDGYKYESWEPEVVGLRYKREFLGEEYDKEVKAFFGYLLFNMRKAILECEEVYIIGFSFQKADGYLWEIAREIEIRGKAYKKILCCNKFDKNERREKYKKRVEDFFNAKERKIDFHFSGFECLNINRKT